MSNYYCSFALFNFNIIFNLFVCFFICLFLYLFVCFFICLFLYLFVSLFVCSFIIFSQTYGPTGLKFSGVDGGHPRMVLGEVW